MSVNNWDQQPISKEVIAKMCEMLHRRPACDHEGMAFWCEPFEGSYYIAFQCPNCSYGGAMHPQQFDEYAKLANLA